MIKKIPNYHVVFRCRNKPKPDITLELFANNEAEAKEIALREMATISKYAQTRDEYIIKVIRHAGQ